MALGWLENVVEAPVRQRFPGVLAVTDAMSPIQFADVPLAWRIFHQRPNFMAILGPSGEVREVNGAIEQRGFLREAFLGRHIADTPYFAADSAWHLTWRIRLAEVAARGEPVGYDDVITTSDGSVRYAEATVTPIWGQDGTVDCFLVEAEDTTERLQVELAMRDWERRANDLLEGMPAIAWSLDGAGRCEFVNQRWHDELGPMPAGGDAWTVAVHPDERAEAEAQWARAMADCVPLAGCFRLGPGTGGAWSTRQVRVAPTLREDGAVIRWCGIALAID